MTCLLVSVRDATEALAAIAGGAEVLDVKEPALGSLGRASSSAVQDVVAAAGGQVPVSVACGELAAPDLTCWPRQALAGVQFAKLGLSHAPRNWQAAWCTWRRGLPSHVTPIAVAYADWQASQAPPPAEVLAFAKLHAGGILLDTHEKQWSLVQGMALVDIKTWIQRVHAAGLLSAVAGSLHIEHLPRLAAFQPAILAVRGCVCVPDRTGHLRRELVRRAAHALRSGQPPRVASVASPAGERSVPWQDS